MVGIVFFHSASLKEHWTSYCCCDQLRSSPLYDSPWTYDWLCAWRFLRQTSQGHPVSSCSQLFYLNCSGSQLYYNFYLTQLQRLQRERLGQHRDVLQEDVQYQYVRSFLFYLWRSCLQKFRVWQISFLRCRVCFQRSELAWSHGQTRRANISYWSAQSLSEPASEEWTSQQSCHGSSHQGQTCFWEILIQCGTLQMHFNMTYPELASLCSSKSSMLQASAAQPDIRQRQTERLTLALELSTQEQEKTGVWLAKDARPLSLLIDLRGIRRWNIFIEPI